MKLGSIFSSNSCTDSKGSRNGELFSCSFGWNISQIRVKLHSCLLDNGRIDRISDKTQTNVSSTKCDGWKCFVQSIVRRRWHTETAAAYWSLWNTWADQTCMQIISLVGAKKHRNSVGQGVCNIWEWITGHRRTLTELISRSNFFDSHVGLLISAFHSAFTKSFQRGSTHPTFVSNCPELLVYACLCRSLAWRWGKRQWSPHFSAAKELQLARQRSGSSICQPSSQDQTCMPPALLFSLDKR